VLLSECFQRERERERNINKTLIQLSYDTYVQKFFKWEGNMFGILMLTFLELFQISLLSLRPSKSEKSLHQKLSDESSNGDSASVSAAETSLINVENIVVTSGTVEASTNLSGSANLDITEHTIETADDALETAVPQ
jgi:hypothetical protein